MDALLELDGVTKSFGGLVAVRNLSFSIGEGEILGLIGPNGAGKTTVFNLISGVYRPEAGSIRFDGKVISGLKPHEVSSLGVARTFQTVRPFARMSVKENVMAGLLFGRGGINAPRRATQKALEMLELVSLLDKAEVRAGHLTLAEQRRLELARALATSPKLLMLDEVVAGLNHSEMNAMVDLLRRIQPERGMALIVIEHVMKAIVRLCNRIVVMNGGEKLVEGSPSEVITDERVVAAYMGRRSNDGESTTTSSSAPQ